jgi:transcriptional regulator of heat shock response
MDAKLLQLLKLVTEEYIASAEPVGSQALVERHGLEVSSATVRNWFSALDEAGLLQQTHTSGGRIPTEDGFRLYVENFITPKSASKKTRDRLVQAATLDGSSDVVIARSNSSRAKSLIASGLRPSSPCTKRIRIIRVSLSSLPSLNFATGNALFR